MTINYLPSTIQTFKSLQSFGSIDELNESIKYAYKNLSQYMTPTSLKILGLLSKYSVKYLGVSFLSKSTIADELNVDIRTVRRSIRQLEELGLITSYRLKRTTGDKRESSSAVVLTKLVSIITLPKCPSINQSISNKKELKIITNTTKASAQVASNDSLIKKGLMTKLPQPLQFLEHFFGMEEIYKICGTIFKAKKAGNGKDIQIEDYASEYYNAILSVLNSYKRNKIKSLHGVLYSAIKALTRSIWLKDRFNHYMA